MTLERTCHRPRHSGGAVLDVGLEKALKATAGVGTSGAGDPEIYNIGFDKVGTTALWPGQRIGRLLSPASSVRNERGIGKKPFV